MKKIAAMLTSLALVAGVLSACGGEADKTVQDNVVPTAVVIGLDDNFPPMGFRDDSNQIVGFDIDMAKEATKRMGVTAEFKPIDWGSKESELNSKRVDILWNGLTITEERQKHILFSSPYMENHQIIVVAKQSAIQNKADLAEKTVGVQDESSAVEAIEGEPEVFNSFKELKKYGDNVTALMDLESGVGRIDALVVDEVVGRYYVAKRPDSYRVLDENFGTEEYGVGLRKEDEALHASLEKALGEMKADGTSATIANKWFGKDIIK